MLIKRECVRETRECFSQMIFFSYIRGSIKKWPTIITRSYLTYNHYRFSIDRAHTCFLSGYGWFWFGEKVEHFGSYFWTWYFLFWLNFNGLKFRFDYSSNPPPHFGSWVVKIVVIFLEKYVHYRTFCFWQFRGCMPQVWHNLPSWYTKRRTVRTFVDTEPFSYQDASLLTAVCVTDFFLPPFTFTQSQKRSRTCKARTKVSIEFKYRLNSTAVSKIKATLISNGRG